MLNEHPLYTFVQDTNPGDHNGQGKALNGSGWHIMLANGTVLATGTPAP
jgi:predicted lipoprotein with Yx(FWY)xxD motif